MGHDGPLYATMSKHGLQALAESKGIPVKARMTKSDLVGALIEADIAKPESALPVSTLTKDQEKTETRKFSIDGVKHRLHVFIRWDDLCNNGHNTFSITGDLEQMNPHGRWEWVAGGCVHDDIAERFPEFAHLIKWHLVSSAGPLHYLSNTTHLAGDRDGWGKRAGEPTAWDTGIVFGDNPLFHSPGRDDKFVKWLETVEPGVSGPYDFEVIRVDHKDRGKAAHYQFKPGYTFGGYAADWYECPFKDEQSALDFLYALQNCNPRFVTRPTAFSEGKQPEIDAARKVAIWPDATLEQLQDESALKARLPELMEAFKADMIALGFTY